MTEAQQLSFPIRPFAEVFPTLLKSGFILYCGAGISIPSPTCAPSWWVLTEEILTAFFNRVPSDYGLPSERIIKSNLWQPEAIFENFANLFDTHLYRVFPVLDVAECNPIHLFIATLAKSGILKACITTNFDRYIEKALEQRQVDYQLVVENAEYDRIATIPPSDWKFLLCKIHGTTERPQTIVSVASAYKSAKGFSPPKAAVIGQLFMQYPVVFMGYSGWDFEHANYRKFWDAVGPKLQHVYWNRRPTETGGPNFTAIFQSCKDRFLFTQAELPNDLIGLMAPLQQAGISFNPEIGKLSALDTTRDQILHNRSSYLQTWAQQISEIATISAVIVEGIHFTAAFQAQQQQTMALSKTSVIVDPARRQALMNEINTIGTRLLSGGLPPSEQDALNERNFYLQLEQQTLELPKEQQDQISQIFRQNKYPGVTDEFTRRYQVIPKILGFLARFPMNQAIELAIYYTRKDMEVTKRGEVLLAQGVPSQTVIQQSEAEMFTNNVLMSLLTPKEQEWKPIETQLLKIKEDYLTNRITRDQFTTALRQISESQTKKSQGLTIPIEYLLKKMIEMAASASGLESFRQGCEMVFLTIGLSAAHINFYLMQTPTYKAFFQKLTSPPLVGYSMEEFQAAQKKFSQVTILLQEKMQKGEIEIMEYGKQMATLGQEYQAAVQKMQQSQMSAATSTVRAVVPAEIFQAMDTTIREMFQPLYSKVEKLGIPANDLSMLYLEMSVNTLWWTATSGGDEQTGKEFQAAWNAGKYPIQSANPSVVQFLREHIQPLILPILTSLPPRFAQRGLDLLLNYSKMANDFELCHKATLRSLELTDGRITEASAIDVPLILAQWYENLGDEIHALQYYQIALEGSRLAVLPAYTDVLLYRYASLLEKHGEKVQALKTLVQYHPKYLGNLPPLKTPAREFAEQLVDRLTHELGYSTPFAVLS